MNQEENNMEGIFKHEEDKDSNVVLDNVIECDDDDDEGDDWSYFWRYQHSVRGR